MSDLNIFLSAIQSAFNTAVKAAVEEATAPLHHQVQCMDTDMTALKERIAALEYQAIVTSNRINDRIAALENNPAQGVDTTAPQALDVPHEALLTALDQQEWFWSKMSDFIQREVDGLGLVSESRVEEVVQEAMDDHTSTYDHDSYDNAVSTVEDYDFDDFIKQGDGDLEDAIRDTIRNMTFEAR